jgi:hypothetical protein
MRRDDACRACGTVSRRSARFCGHCGERLTDAARTGPPGRRRPSATTARFAIVLAGVIALGVLGLLVPAGPDPGDVDGAPSAATGSARGEVLLPPATAVPRASGSDRAGDDRPAGGGVCSGNAGVVDCVRWSADLGVAEPRSVVTVGWTIAVAEQDGRVRTFSATDGRPGWRHTATGPPRFHDPVAQTLPITGDGATAFVDVATGRGIGDFAGRPRTTAASGPWLLVVGDAGIEARSVTGSSAWRVPVPANGLGWVTANGPYLTTPISLRQDRLVRLSSNTGGVSWEHTVRGRVASLHPVGSSTLVAVEDTGDGAGLLLLDRAGTVQLDHRFSGRVSSVATDHAGAAVVTNGPGGAELLLVDPLTPAVLGPRSLGRVTGWPLPLALDGERVAVAAGDPDPGVLVVGRRNGAVERRFALPAVPRAVALPEGRTVVAVVDTEVSAWSLATGTSRWWLDLGRPADVVSERPLLVRTDRALLALDADPSRPRRQLRGTTS